MAKPSVTVNPAGAATAVVVLVSDDTGSDESWSWSRKTWRVDVTISPGWRFVDGSVMLHSTWRYSDGTQGPEDHHRMSYVPGEPLLEYLEESKFNQERKEQWYEDVKLNFEQVPDSTITVKTVAAGPGTASPVADTRHGRVGTSASFQLDANGPFLFWVGPDGRVLSWLTSISVSHVFDTRSREYVYQATFASGGGGGVTPGGHGGEPGDETKYAYISVTLGHSPSDGGSTSPSGTTVYCGNPGDSLTVQMSATPTDGFKFVKWTQDGSEVSTSASYETTLVFPEIGYVDSYTFNAEFEEEEPKTGSIRLVCVPQPLSLDRFSVNPTVSEKTGSVGDSLSWFVSASVKRGFKALYRFVEWRDDVTGDVVLSSKTGNVSKTVTKADEREDWVLRAVFEEVGTTGLPLYDGGTGEILFGSDGRVLCDA